MSHPQHPSCSCGKALFKSATAAKVKPSDPYAFCRNQKCEHYTFRRMLGKPGFDPKKPTPEQVKGALRVALAGGKVVADKPAKLGTIVKPTIATNAKSAKPTLHVLEEAARAAREVAPTKPVSKRGVRRAAMPASEAPAKPSRPAEPEAIAKARARLRELLSDMAAGAPREAVGLVLAILSQETKSQKAAEALIDEFQLDTKFGLQKFTDT